MKNAEGDAAILQAYCVLGNSSHLPPPTSSALRAPAWRSGECRPALLSGDCIFDVPRLDPRCDADGEPGLPCTQRKY
jgi:hypothetical protein